MTIVNNVINANSVTPLPVTDGGTGANTLTIHGLLKGDAAGAVSALPAATNGQLPIGSTGGDPVLATLTAGTNVTITNGAGSITIAASGGGGGGIATLDGDTGSATGGVVTLAGGNNITTSASGATVTFDVSGTTVHAVQVGSATNSLNSLAVGTTGQVLIGATAADPAFGALGVNSGLTTHGLLLGQGSSAITALGDATNGQLAIGSTGADPVLATLTSSGNTVAITNGAGSINLETGGAVSSSFPTNSGTAIPSAGALTLTGTGNISTSGAGSTATFTLSGTTAHAVQIGNSGGTLTSLGVGTTGQVLIGSTGADPAFGSLGVNSSLTAHGILLGQNNSAITALGDATNGQLPIGSTGADPVLNTLTAGAGISITNGAGTITVTSSITQGIITLDGDTGSAAGTTVTLSGGNNITTSASGSVVTLNVSGTTNHAVQVGNATNSLTSLGVGTTGQVLIGSTGANPSFGALGVNSGLTAHGLLLGQNNSAITALGDATNGQLPIGSTGADPVLATLTAGSGITVTNGAGSITVASSITQGIVTLDGDSGSATGTTVTLAGGNNITTAASGSTVTFNVSGTTNHAVQVGNATNSLTSLGVGTTGQVLIGSTGANPAFGALGVNSGLTAHGLLLGQNNSAITALGDATNGQIPIGSTGADPVLATLGSSGSTIAITNGAGSINLETGSAVAASFPTNSGTAVPSSGALTLTGTGNISTSGSGSTATFTLSGTTNHAVQIGNAGGTLTSLGVGTTGQVLIGSTGANPSFGALGVNSGLTAHGLLLGQNNSAITALGDATNGQIPIGSTGADPVLATLASSGSTIAITNGAGTINLETGSAVSNSFPTDSGTATPSSGALTVKGGSNINTSGATSIVTVNLNTSPSVSGSLTAGTSVNAGTVVLAAAGTVGAPSYSFTGNTATGLYAPASGQFALSAAGVNKVNYDGSSVLVASTYRMSAQLTSNATILTGATDQLIFDTVIISSAGYNSGTSTYTAPVSGAYFISVMLAASCTATGIVQAQVRKNGSTILFNFPSQFTSTGTFSDLTSATTSTTSRIDLNPRRNSGSHTYKEPELLRGVDKPECAYVYVL